MGFTFRRGPFFAAAGLERRCGCPPRRHGPKSIGTAAGPVGSGVGRSPRMAGPQRVARAFAQGRRRGGLSKKVLPVASTSSQRSRVVVRGTTLRNLYHPGRPDSVDQPTDRRLVQTAAAPNRCQQRARVPEGGRARRSASGGRTTRQRSRRKRRKPPTPIRQAKPDANGCR